jgi:hypothetical protein
MKKEPMQIGEETRRALAPLREHRTQILGRTSWGDPVIGCGYSGDPNCPTISYEDFVANVVLPSLGEACGRYGQEQVASALARLTQRLCEADVQSGDSPVPGFSLAATFLGATIQPPFNDQDRNELNVIPGNTVPELIGRFGVDYVLGPIVELGLEHQKANIFTPSKFLHCHARRLGELIANFPEDDYRAYIDASATLLRGGVYDWGLEQSPEEWGMLAPSIRTHGLGAVFAPIVSAMLRASKVPGALRRKYKNSMLCWSIRSYYPFLLPRVRGQGGPGEIASLLEPLIVFLEDAFESGRLGSNSVPGSPQWLFFADLPDRADQVQQLGMRSFVNKNRSRWMKSLPKAA